MKSPTRSPAKLSKKHPSPGSSCRGLDPVLPPPLWIYIKVAEISDLNIAHIPIKEGKPKCNNIDFSALSWNHLRVRVSCRGAIASLEELKLNKGNGNKTVAPTVAFKELLIEKTEVGDAVKDTSIKNISKIDLVWQPALEISALDQDEITTFKEEDAYSEQSGEESLIVIETWATMLNMNAVGPKSNTASVYWKEHEEILIGLAKIYAPGKLINKRKSDYGSISPHVLFDGWINICNPYTGEVMGKLLVTTAL
eukprot:5360726-Ditylum_brightwellii.AAC.1